MLTKNFLTSALLATSVAAQGRIVTASQGNDPVVLLLPPDDEPTAASQSGARPTSAAIPSTPSGRELPLPAGIGNRPQPGEASVFHDISYAAFETIDMPTSWISHLTIFDHPTKVLHSTSPAPSSSASTMTKATFKGPPLYANYSPPLSTSSGFLNTSMAFGTTVTVNATMTTRVFKTILKTLMVQRSRTSTVTKNSSWTTFYNATWSRTEGGQKGIADRPTTTAPASTLTNSEPAPRFTFSQTVGNEDGRKGIADVSTTVTSTLTNTVAAPKFTFAPTDGNDSGNRENQNDAGLRNRRRRGRFGWLGADAQLMPLHRPSSDRSTTSQRLSSLLSPEYIGSQGNSSSSTDHPVQVCLRKAGSLHARQQCMPPPHIPPPASIVPLPKDSPGLDPTPNIPPPLTPPKSEPTSSSLRDHLPPSAMTSSESRRPKTSTGFSHRNGTTHTASSISNSTRGSNSSLTASPIPVSGSPTFSFGETPSLTRSLTTSTFWITATPVDPPRASASSGAVITSAGHDWKSFRNCLGHLTLWVLFVAWPFLL